MICKEHSNYRGLSEPQNDCVTCWKIYCENQEYQIKYLDQRLEEVKKKAEEEVQKKNKLIMFLKQKLRKGGKKVENLRNTL